MVKNVILFFVFTISLFPQNFSAGAGADSSSYLIGDFINYRVKLKHPDNYKYALWDIQKNLGGLDLISVSQPLVKAEGGIQNVEITYTVAGYDSGSKVISGGEVIFFAASGDTQRVRVDSTILFINIVDVDTSAEIKDINEPRRIPLSTAEILLWIGIVAGIILIGYLIYRFYPRKEKKEEIPVVPEIPVDERVMQKLADLEAKKLWQNGKIREYHTEITEIVRWYFEEKLKIPALEMTTGEICRSLSTGLNMSEVAKVTESFLNNADLVKFAKFVPLAGINEEMMTQAREIVRLCISRDIKSPSALGEKNV
ncbi:MAG: hypothetical protein HUU54_15640 [Ignavibacteriaceae bacterium]|nr:hypothetical protein [Ignavibacteriaceae bacterium]